MLQRLPKLGLPTSLVFSALVVTGAVSRSMSLTTSLLDLGRDDRGRLRHKGLLPWYS
jgi:hypothetical protein